MVLYFTGTGNSRYIAEKIAETLEEPLYSLNDAIKSGDKGTVHTGGRVILVTPTYAWRIPRAVRDWLLQADLPEAEKIWFIMDCGDEIGNAAKYNKQLAAQKKLSYMGTAQIVMPENYIAMFNTPTESEAEAILVRALPVIAAAAETILAGGEFPLPRNNLYDRFMSGPVNKVFYPFCVKADAFRAGDACVGCGRCDQLCPLNNIRIVNGRPVWGKNCTHCMACISYCPKEAVEYGKHSVGLRRYHM